MLAGNPLLVTSREIEAEYREVVSRKKIVALFARHRVPRDAYRRAVDVICFLAERVSPTGEPPPCRDERDRKYLHCAGFGSVDYVVTYDRDLLDLDNVSGVPIVTPAELLRRIRSTKDPLVE